MLAGGLVGIWRLKKCRIGIEDFAEAAAIPAADLGYAAIAQGLGIIKGDDRGNFAPGRTSTRCEAAYMLWLYMKR